MADIEAMAPFLATIPWSPSAGGRPRPVTPLPGTPARPIDERLDARGPRRGDATLRRLAGEHGRDQPRFGSDNNGFDWQFINWYFHHLMDRNPVGHSSTNLERHGMTPAA
jgi:hypothetical protein